MKKVPKNNIFQSIFQKEILSQQRIFQKVPKKVSISWLATYILWCLLQCLTIG